MKKFSKKPKMGARVFAVAALTALLSLFIMGVHKLGTSIAGYLGTQPKWGIAMLCLLAAMVWEAYNELED